MKKKWSLCLGALLALLSLTALSAAKNTDLRGTGYFDIPDWFKPSFLHLREDVSEATENKKRLLVYFGQDGCPYCAELFNNNFSQPHIVEYARQHFDAIDLNIWGNRLVTDLSGAELPENEFAEKLQVRFTPTILFLNEKGATVLRINGYYPPHQFLAALHYVAEKQEQNITFRDYLAKSAPPAAKGILHREPFFAKQPYDLTKRLGNKPIAVLFEQKDCAGCDQLHEKILRIPATRKLLNRFYTIQLDRWSNTPITTPDGRQTTARQWADDLNIVYVPTTVLVDRGKEVIRLDTVMKAFHYQSILDYVSSGAYREPSGLQRYIRARADRLREQGVVVDLWE